MNPANHLLVHGRGTVAAAWKAWEGQYPNVRVDTEGALGPVTVVPTKGTPRDMGPALQALDRLLNRREREARRALQRRNLNELQEINESGRVMYYVRVSTTGGMKKVLDQVMATTVDELVGVWLNDKGP